jgi:hypothetical protein
MQNPTTGQAVSAQSIVALVSRLNKFVHGLKQSVLTLNKTGEAKIRLALEGKEEYLRQVSALKLETLNDRELTEIYEKLNTILNELLEVKYPFEDAFRGDYIYVYMSNNMRALLVVLGAAWIAYKYVL